MSISVAATHLDKVHMSVDLNSQFYIYTYNENSRTQLTELDQVLLA